MDKIIRCITSDGAVMVSAIDSTDIAYKASVIHGTSPVASAALGRLLSAASMMGAQLKSSKSTINIRFEGDGELGAFLAVADAYGNVKGYVTNPDCPTDHYNSGKLNVAKAVGRGIMSVMKDFGEGEPYIGKIPIVSGEIAEDVTNYYAEREQVPTVCALGVLIDTDHTCRAAGGILIQLLPFADEATVEQLEKNVPKLANLSAMIDSGMDNKAIADIALEGIPYDVFDELTVEYKCNCSKEKMDAVIQSLGRSQVEKLLAEQVADGKPEELEINCRFCNSHYTYNRAELEGMDYAKP